MSDDDLQCRPDRELIEGWSRAAARRMGKPNSTVLDRYMCSLSSFEAGRMCTLVMNIVGPRWWVKEPAPEAKRPGRPRKGSTDVQARNG